MNDVLKQRLVGALILVALGVVFWPIIFVEPGKQPAAEHNRIPPRPAVDTTPIEPPDSAGLRASPELELDEERERQDALEPGPEAEPAPVLTLEAPVAVAEPAPPAPAPPEQHTRAESPERPVLDSDGIPVAWILQVASVSSASKADELRDRLLGLEQKAYVKKVERGKKALYRVYIGPKFERAQLEQLQADIDRQFGVKSMIVRYIP